MKNYIKKIIFVCSGLFVIAGVFVLLGWKMLMLQQHLKNMELGI